MGGYRDLKVWARGMEVAAAVYDISRKMPQVERYGLTSQVLRSAASVPANIAEGYQRGTRKDYAHFVSIARGSLAETETFLLLATRVGLLTPEQTQPVLDQVDELGRMLTRLRLALIRPERSHTPDPRP